MNDTVDPRLRVLAAGSLDDAAGTLQSVAGGSLSAALVRGVYGAEQAAQLVSRLERGEFPSPFRIRDVSDTSVPQIRTLGLAISPSDLYPAGPDLEAYHAAAVELRNDAASFFAPVPPFPETAYAILSALSGTPVTLAADDRGRAYGALTIRNMPHGCGLPPHCENHYMHIRAYDALRQEVMLDHKVGFFCVLQTPHSGGEFVVYDDAYKAGEFAFQTRSLDIDHGRGHVVVPAAAGDMVVVGSGARYHQVTRVEGERSRWSVGGFGAFATDSSRFVCWA